jgi:hypothetical protein
MNPVAELRHFKKADVVPEKDPDDPHRWQRHHMRILGLVSLCVTHRKRTPSPVLSITLVGHTSPEGSDRFNEQLGKARAVRIAQQLRPVLTAMGHKVLIDKAGTGDEIVLITKTKGASESGRKPFPESRRVEINFAEVLCDPLGPCIVQ